MDVASEFWEVGLIVDDIVDVSVGAVEVSVGSSVVVKVDCLVVLSVRTVTVCSLGDVFEIVSVDNVDVW